MGGFDYVKAYEVEAYKKVWRFGPPGMYIGYTFCCVYLIKIDKSVNQLLPNLM